MKILAYTDTFFPTVGGAEMVLHHLANTLTGEYGDRVDVLAPKRAAAMPSLEISYPIHRYAHPSSKRFLVRQTIFHLIRLHLKNRYHILHCHAAYPQAYVGATFKKLFKCPFVVRPHGSDIVPGGRMRRNKRLERRLTSALLQADAVIAQGDYLKQVVSELGVTDDKIFIINNGVDLEQFAVSSPFPHDRPYILAVGSLIRRKGFDVLLQAFRKAEIQGVDLLIAGQGREEKNLRNMVLELGLGDRVHFLGNITGQRKTDLYASALFFVCPSRKEPFANVILEAFAAGLPVVASSVDGNTELVGHREQGLLTPVEDSDRLAAAMRELVDDRELFQQIRQGLPGYISQFDWKIVAQKYRSVYSQIVSQATG